jgi:hypothetical protein
MNIADKGNPKSKVWVIVEKPYKTDEPKGYVFSGGLGWVWEKMMQDAGIDEYYVTSRISDREHPTSFSIVENYLNQHRPPIIFTLENSTHNLVPAVAKAIPRKKGKQEQDYKSDLEKFAGSLLISPKLNYPHYIIPTFAPDSVVRDWSVRDIVTSLDLGKGKIELDYFLKHGMLNPIPTRTLLIDFTDFDLLLSELEALFSARLISNDIETLYPKAKSEFKKIHPGLPVTIGLAASKEKGISFELFRTSRVETIKLWQVLARLFYEVPVLGQNFNIFDRNFYEALGFEFGQRITDTMLRHHVLHPELPHKLQFMTRQYTREPYYKDEGHGWSGKNMQNLKKYNARDCCITMEVYEGQEEEFEERPWLK